MYIDKWWGNGTCGDCDDSLTLIGYFDEKNKEKYTLAEILKEFGLYDILGKLDSTLNKGSYLLNWQMETLANWQIEINFYIDMAALLLQSLVETYVELERCEKPIKFTISMEKEELKMFVSDLEDAISNPTIYYPDFLQEEFAEMIPGIMEICNELKQHYLED